MGAPAARCGSVGADSEGDAVTPNIPISAWLPDVDQTVPGVLSDVYNLVPTRRGYGSEYSLEDSVLYTGTLADEALSTGTLHLADDMVVPLVGTDDGIYYLNIGSIVDRTNVTPYNARSQQLAYWRFGAIGGVLLAAQYDNTLQYTTSIASTDFADVSGGPKAYTMAVQRGFVIVGNIKDGSYAGAQSWLCSAQDDYTDWTPDIATGSAAGELTATPGAIIRMIAFRDYVIAFKERSFHRGQFVGFASNTWEWPVVSTTIGVVGHDAVCEVDGVLYWLSESGFYRWAGGAVDRIASAPYEWLIDNSSGYGFLQDTQAMWDPVQRVVRWVLSFPGDFTGKIVLTYHPDTDKWGKSVLDVWRAVRLAYETVPSISNDNPMLRAMPLAYIGSDGKVKIASNTPGESYFTTGDVGDDNQVFDLSRARVRYFIAPTSSTAAHSTRMQLGDTPTIVATSDRVDGKYDLSESARWHRVKFTQSGRYEVSGFRVDMPKAGTR